MSDEKKNERGIEKRMVANDDEDDLILKTIIQVKAFSPYMSAGLASNRTWASPPRLSFFFTWDFNHRQPNEEIRREANGQALPTIYSVRPSSKSCISAHIFQPMPAASQGVSPFQQKK